MQTTFEDSSYNGIQTSSGNYIWAGALSLAWTQFKNEFAKQDIKVNTKNHRIHSIVDNFNKSKFSKKDLNLSCYYIKSGAGNKTVEAINREVKQKFPDKTIETLKNDLLDTDIISYAYLRKMLQFQVPFTQGKQQKFGNIRRVKYFQAQTMQQKKQIEIHQYSDQNNFIINILTKTDKKQQIFMIKNQQQFLSIDSVLKYLQEKIVKNPVPLQKHDKFKMPYIDLEINRNFDEFIELPFKNEKLVGYQFKQIHEIIKFKIDEKGLKLQNQGKVVVSKGVTIIKQPPKHIYLDNNFWIVLKQKNKHPYLVCKIVNPTK